jgi:hypothetical protein
MEDTSNDFVNGRKPKIILKREDDLKYFCKGQTS